jgi:hypothetical protein
MGIKISLWAIATVGVTATSSDGEVTLYEDFAEWQAATGSIVSIDFTDLPQFTFVTDQYADQGVIFTDGDDIIFGPSPTFPSDGFGIDGQGEFNLQFSSPQAWIGTHLVGTGQLQLFYLGTLIFTSNPYDDNTGFVGFTSTELFDAVRIFDDDPSVVFDNLHFGVPGPGALPPLALAGLMGARRRRRVCRR